MTHIPDSMMGEDSLVGWGLSDLNPITHLKTRARQLANAAMFIRRAGSRLDPVSLVMNRLPGYRGGGGGGSAQQQAPDDSQQPQPDDGGDMSESAGDFAIGCAERINGLPPHPRFHVIRHLHRHALMGGDFAIGSATEAALQATPAGAAIVQANRLAKIGKSSGVLSRFARILQRHKAGDKSATKAIAAVHAKAKKGDPKAKAAVANLKKVDDLSKMNFLQRGALTLSQWYRAGIS